MSVLGENFAMVMLLAGAWDAIAKIENMLPRLEDKLNIDIISKRTTARQTNSSLMPYAVEVVSIDRPGIVHDIAQFFSERDIGIDDMYSSSYSAVHSNAPMFSLHMTISVPTNNSVSALRGEFMELCDHLNLDAVMEPVK